MTPPVPDLSSTVSPPQLARRYRCKPEKIIGLIRAGKLAAFSIASEGAKRPRYRIDLREVEAFELRRSVLPAPKSTRRRKRRDPDVIDFF